MRIVMVSPTAAGGHPVYVNEITSALSHRSPVDMSVELVAPKNLDDDFRDVPYLIHDILPSVPDTTTGNLIFRRLRLVIHLISLESVFLRWLKRQVDIGVIHFQVLSLCSSFFMRRYRKLGIPLFATIHNIKPHKYVIPKHMEDSISRWMWNQCDGLFVLTESLAVEADAFLGPRHPPIFIAAHGVFGRTDNSNSSISLAERLKAKKILFFGVIRRDKGLHIALAAMKYLKDFQLTIAGKIDDQFYWRETIEPVIKELQLSGIGVEVKDEYIPEASLSALFASHSFVILPYTKEFVAQSGVLHLALGMSTPIVATSVGGIEEIISKWNVGETAPPENPIEMSDAVMRLYHRDLQVLEANLELARSQLTWEHCAEITMEAYRGAIHQN